MAGGQLQTSCSPSSAQPAELLAYVDIPSSLGVWGIDSGIRHAVSGADYGTVRPRPISTDLA